MGQDSSARAAGRTVWPESLTRIGAIRFAADVQALAADEEPAERIGADRLLGPDQAAERLESKGTGRLVVLR